VAKEKPQLLQQKTKEWFLPAARDLTQEAAKVGKFSFLISIRFPSYHCNTTRL